MTITCDSVHPHTIGVQGLAKAELDPVVTEMLTVQGAHGPNHTADITILTERVRRVGALLLDVNFLETQMRYLVRGNTKYNAFKCWLSN